MSWIYKGKKVESLDDIPDNAFGFIYEITHIPSGRKYIGKKQLIFKRKRKIGKRETKRLKEEKKENGETNWWIVPKKKIVKKESDWLDYYGSSEEVKELLEEGNKEDFKREILDYATHKKNLSYKETKILFEYGVLEDQDTFINSNIQGKFYPKDVKDKI